MEISEIKAILKQRKITYEKLSEMSSIPIQTIQKIFGGYTTHPRIDTMHAIEKALDIDETQSVPAFTPDMPIAFYEGIKDFDEETKQDLFKYFQYLQSQKKK